MTVILSEQERHILLHTLGGEKAGHNAEWADAFRRIYRRWWMLHGDGSEPTAEMWEGFEEALREGCVVAADHTDLDAVREETTC